MMYMYICSILQESLAVYPAEIITLFHGIPLFQGLVKYCNKITGRADLRGKCPLRLARMMHGLLGIEVTASRFMFNLQELSRRHRHRAFLAVQTDETTNKKEIRRENEFRKQNCAMEILSLYYY